MTIHYPPHNIAQLPRAGAWRLLIIALMGIAFAVSTVAVSTAAILTLAVSAGLILLRWPWLAWPAFAIFLPVSSGIKAGTASLTEPMLLLAAFLWFVDGVRTKAVRLHHTVLLFPLALYGLVLCLSLLGASNLGESASEVAKWLEFAAILVLVPVSASSRNLPWMVGSIIVAATLQAAFGLYQFTNQIGPEWFVVSERYMRASGSFMQPNPFAGYLGLVLPVVFSLSVEGWFQLVSRGNRRDSTWVWTAFYSISLGIIGTGLIASLSRGAWLGSATGLMIVVVLHKRRRAMLVPLMSIALAAVIVLAGAGQIAYVGRVIVERIGEVPGTFDPSQAITQEVTDENFSVIERLAHWAAALRMWDRAPWLGIGPGNYETVYPDVRLALWEEPLGHAHNIYLNVLAETGILGLLTFLLFWISAVRWIWWRARQFVATPSNSPEQSWNAAVAVGVLGVIGHVAVHSLFDNLFVQGMYLQVALWLAVLAAMKIAAVDVGTDKVKAK